MSERFATLDQALAWRERHVDQSIRPGLERILAGVAELQIVFDCPLVIVGGTNGKGSTVTYLESIYHAAGYRTGCYLSPQLYRFNDRIRLQREDVDDASLLDAFKRVAPLVERLGLTLFEFDSLLAFDCLHAATPEVVILEVGMGGEFDAVNVFDADVALITNVALDHMQWLGRDVDTIGRTKAGIARAGRPLVLGAPDIAAGAVARGREIGAEIFRRGVDFDLQRQGDGWSSRSGSARRNALPLPPMRGAHQLDNAAAALMAVELLQSRLPVDQQAVRNGLLDARLPGRIEVRGRACKWILDVAHNPAAATQLAGALKDIFVPGHVYAVVGMLADKDQREVITQLAGRVDNWCLVDLGEHPRGATAAQLQAAMPETASMLGSGDIDECLALVDEQAGSDDLVVVFGSFVTVQLASEWLDRHPYELNHGN